jgi:hypothetical protein
MSDPNSGQIQLHEQMDVLEFAFRARQPNTRRKKSRRLHFDTDCFGKYIWFIGRSVYFGPHR